ncbi:MAG: DNA replication and repair protein RecF [Candidatus Levyibacteriota bacterium]
MHLKNLELENFRNHQKASFEFSDKITFIVGPNTSGKTNLLEAITFIATGKSSRGAKDEEVVRSGEILAKAKGKTQDTELEVLVILGDEDTFVRGRRKYLVNGVAKSRLNFSANLAAVIFSPSDLDIITGSPHLRREFLDAVLEQTDRDYRYALSSYVKALRQRNALLDLAQGSGARNEKQFDYWDTLLINTGSVITKKREEFLEFINKAQKDIFDFVVTYDKSIISETRLEQYKDAEVASGVTLVGPHRDDFKIDMFDNATGSTKDLKSYGSRGQHRLVILQLKLLQLDFIEKTLGERPLLLLDDIFSELDEGHIKLVSEMIDKQQSIVTTTHEEFINSKLRDTTVIELKK